jgi:F-type H+-transporting ATPase subunit alpha
MNDGGSGKIKIPLLDIREVGFVKDLRQGIAKVSGLPSCVYGQMVQFSCGIKGIVMGFNPQEVLVVILGRETGISSGDSVISLSELLSVPVGHGFLGRIVNSLAVPLDNKGEITGEDLYPVFREAPGVMEREPVEDSLLTGIKIIDLTIPIG